MKNFTITIYFMLIASVAFSQYNVGFRFITVRDQSRFRNIITNIYYPAATAGTNVPVLDNGTKFPVVSFGHGFLMSSLAYQWLAQSLASAGYIVSFPATEEGTPNHAEFGRDELFVARILRNYGDTATSFLYQKTNGYTAVGGHSMGGGASFLAMNGVSDITTFFNFSAAETFGIYGIVATEAAKNITRPGLIFTGSKDCVAPPVGNSKTMYQNLKSEYKFFANIKDASHCQFGDPNKTVCEVGELVACFGTTYISAAVQQSKTLALLKPWLDFWLKRDCNAITTFYNNATSNLSSIDTLQSKVINCSALDITTGIRQNKNLKAELFPNPSNGTFMLTVKENYATAVLTLFDITGKIIDSRVYKNDNTIQLDYSYLAKGMYQLQLETDNGSYISKVLIE
jgi:pimeloyl-ACP methyl ester carboxylesterase